ncbi:MAG TPA: NAD(P)/FAD-dependent oxidoreductase [Candidatus Limnocylindria bacterium]|nr:NAD(P)/FAD-dependent oxidoreductase [Candidatus Limnocylindria bacterium]
MNGSTVDALVIGGGPAGLGAALALGRARRSVVVCDSGDYRNRSAHAMHGFPSRDGMPPAAFRDEIWREMAEYEAVERRDARVSDLRGSIDRFEALLADGTRVPARRVLLAPGVRDRLPPVRGLEELWGTRAVTCPYCDGWELRDAALGVLVSPEAGLPYVRTVRAWSTDLVVFACDGLRLDETQRRWLETRRIGVRTDPVQRVEERDGSVIVSFVGGSSVERRAIFVSPDPAPRGELAAQLGCALTADGFVVVDASGCTSVPGVFAAGDVRRADEPHHAMGAAADGSSAGMAMNADLLAHDDPAPGD